MSLTDVLSNGVPVVGTTKFSLRYDNANSIIAQSFIIPDNDVLITSIKLNMKKIASPTGNMWVEIHSSRVGTSASKNTSTNIVGAASANVDVSTYGTTFAWQEFTLATPAELSGGETYYIMCYASTTVSTTNYIGGHNNAGNIYANGTAWKINNSQVWTSAAPYDITFRLYGSYLFSENILVSDSAESTYTYTDTFVENVSVSDDPAAHTQSIYTNFAYYLLSSDGKVYEYSPTYKGDDSTPITKQFITKNTDFTDQGSSPSDIFKTVYAVKVFYLDLDANTNVTLYISNNDGTTWESTGTKALGTGSGQAKTSTYHFPGGKTGQFFKFKLESGSATTRITWLGLEAEYEECGPHFNIT